MYQIQLFANSLVWKKTQSEINDWLSKHPNIKDVQFCITHNGLALLYKVDK